MKRTIALFVAAVATLAVAMNAPRRTPWTVVNETMDLSGVEELRIAGHASIDIAIGPPRYEWRRSPAAGEDDGLRFRRDGRVMHVTPVNAGYVSLTVPPDIRRLVLEGGSVNAKSLVRDLTVTSTESIDVNGRMHDLTIVALGPSDCEDDERAYCDADVEIAAQVSRLQVYAADKYVVLQDPERVGSARFHFGERARLSIHDARDLAKLNIVHDGGLPEDAEPIR